MKISKFEDKKHFSEKKVSVFWMKCQTSFGIKIENTIDYSLKLDHILWSKNVINFIYLTLFWPLLLFQQSSENLPEIWQAFQSETADLEERLKTVQEMITEKKGLTWTREIFFNEKLWCYSLAASITQELKENLEEVQVEFF